MIALGLLGLAGCGGSTTTPPPAPFEIAGAWIFLGPSDGPHDLTISNGSMVYTDTGGQWSSHWTVKSYDNGLHHFQLTFDSGTGTYLPVGQSLSGTYDLGSLLTIQLADGLTSYPPLEGAGSCTSPTDGTPIPNCRLYAKGNN
jgi:hypothetical protein